MARSDLEFATLIGSRIFHDLISPIGAINNGLELVSMSGGGSGPEMELIGDSVGSASARIRFFRIAFGAAGDQSLGSAEVTSILRDLYRESRSSVAWNIPDAQPRSDVRLAFLALLCLETGMPYGGAVVVERDGAKWVIRGTAHKLIIDPDLWALLATQDQKLKLKPAHVQFGLLPAIASDDGRQITSKATETEIMILF